MRLALSTFHILPKSSVVRGTPQPSAEWKVVPAQQRQLTHEVVQALLLTALQCECSIGLQGIVACAADTSVQQQAIDGKQGCCVRRIPLMWVAAIPAGTATRLSAAALVGQQDRQLIVWVML